MSTVRPRNADELTSTELATAATDMDRVLKDEPLLSDNGLKCDDIEEGRFLEWREDIRRPDSLARFMAARGWLRQFSKIKSVNKAGTSYGLKHCAEDDIGYLTNGCFIAAAIAEGFTVRRSQPNSPNALLNISTEAWRRTDRNREAGRRRAYEAAYRLQEPKLSMTASAREAAAQLKEKV
jgi:hypothetical protein